MYNICDMKEQLDIFHTARSLGGEATLSPKDLKELSIGCERVYTLMKDGNWHAAMNICYAAGNGSFATEGLRRLRELRGAGIEIEKRRGAGRLFEYRLKGIK